MLAGILAGFLKVGAVVLVSAGLGAGVYFAVQAGQDEDALSDQATATSTPGALSPPASLTPTDAAPTATAPQPTATDDQPPPPADTPTPGPTPDTRIPIMDRPTLDQIQLGPDGKYFVADRGDGCRWVEGFRRQDETVGLEVSLFTDCPGDFFFDFRPESGEIFLGMP